MQNQIIIANVDNERMLGDITAVPTHVFESTALVSNRLLWLARAGDIIILPRVPSARFLKYIQSIINIDFSNITILTPNEIAQHRTSITSDILLSERLLTQIKRALNKRPELHWNILPYYFTTAVGQLGRNLAKELSLDLPSFNTEGGAEPLNQKTIFRKLAAGIKIPFATGEVVDNIPALKKSIAHLLKFTGSVIVKQDKSAGGDGNYVISSTHCSSFKGARKFFSLDNYTLEEISEIIQAELITAGNESLTIEVYYDASAVVYSEYFLGGSNSVEYLSHGVMRMQPLWSGFEIPGQIPPKNQATFIHNSTTLALLAKSLGYVGHLNIDAIITPDDKIIFTEVNGRIGGCTHVHTVAQQLLGSNYLNTHQITTYNSIFVESFQSYLNALIKHNINFSESTQKGTLILSSDQHDNGTALELMFIGSDIKETLSIETAARALANTQYDQRP